MATTKAKRDVERLEDLRPDPRNARRHDARNVDAIRASLGEVGAGRSIVIDEEGTILAGNATVEAATAAGLSRVRVVDTDGRELIAVRRSDLTPEEKTRLALADNRAAELADWDPAVLAALREEGALVGIFADYEVAMLLGEMPEGEDPRELWMGMPEYAQDDLSPFRSITVHCASKEDFEAFSRAVNQTITDQAKWIWYPYRERGAAVVCGEGGGDES